MSLQAKGALGQIPFWMCRDELDISLILEQMAKWRCFLKCRGILLNLNGSCFMLNPPFIPALVGLISANEEVCRPSCSVQGPCRCIPNAISSWQIDQLRHIKSCLEDFCILFALRETYATNPDTVVALWRFSAPTANSMTKHAAIFSDRAEEHIVWD